MEKTEKMKTKLWYKEPIKAHHAGCLCCPSTVTKLPMRTKLYNGFGGWSITKNGELFFMESPRREFNNSKTLIYIEKLIGEDEDSEYVAMLLLPLRDAKYQRHGKNNWVLIEQGLGFA